MKQAARGLGVSSDNDSSILSEEDLKERRDLVR
jgi:hypothetical protein